MIAAWCLLVRAGWCWLLVGRYAATLNAGEFVLAGDTCLLGAGCWLVLAGSCWLRFFGFWVSKIIVSYCIKRFILFIFRYL